MRATEQHLWRLAVAALLGLLVVSVLNPRAAVAQDSSVSVGTGVVDGEFRIEVQPAGTPIAALELTVTGLPPSLGECSMNELLGACSSSEGVLRFVGVHPVGLSDDVVVARAPLNGGDAAGAEVVVSVSTDPNGDDLAWQPTQLTDAALSAPSGPLEIEAAPPAAQPPTEQSQSLPVASESSQTAAPSSSSAGLNAGTLIAIVLVGLVFLTGVAAVLSRRDSS